MHKVFCNAGACQKGFGKLILCKNEKWHTINPMTIWILKDKKIPHLYDSTVDYRGLEYFTERHKIMAESQIRWSACGLEPLGGGGPHAVLWHNMPF